jgi:hypothetical protein
MGGADQADELGTARAQALDRGSQEEADYQTIDKIHEQIQKLEERA